MRGHSYGVRHLTVEAPASVVDFVEVALTRESERPPLSSLELIELGSVYVNDQRSLAPARSLLVGDRVRIHTRPRRYPQPVDLPSRVVREDEDVIVVDKPAGLPVHALVDNINENLISYLEDLRGGTLFITHRLDVETSGLVLLAKNPEEQARLNRAFASAEVKRTYAAYSLASVTQGEHVHYMEPSPKAPKVLSSTAREGWQRCSMIVAACTEMVGSTSVVSEGRTSWTLSASVPHAFRVEIVLQTGRPQQIRAQLAALGAPIIGDIAYGSTVSVVDAGSSRAAVCLRAISVNV